MRLRTATFALHARSNGDSGNFMVNVGHRARRLAGLAGILGLAGAGKNGDVVCGF